MTMPAHTRRLAGTLLAMASTLPVPVAAQITAADYYRAEQFMGEQARVMVTGDQVSPRWLADGRFWYRSRVQGGTEFVIVDPAAATREPAFDHDRLASALSVAADTSYEALRLPFDEFELDDEGIRFELEDTLRWACDTRGYTCTGPTVIPRRRRSERSSPDGAWVAFTRDHDLWIRSTADSSEVRLTTDGEQWHAYAVNDQCCSQVTAPRSDTERPPALEWSPDSRYVATLKLDRRGVEDLHLLETATGRPELHTYRYGLPGDSVIPTYDLHVFDVEARTGRRIDAPTQEAVNTVCCGIMADTVLKDVRWAPEGDAVYFTVGQRDFDRLRLMSADPSTGEAREILEETARTYVETSPLSSVLPNWRIVEGSGEVIWWSERDGWGHLYRYDAGTGRLLNRITEGPWLVHEVVHVDGSAGWVYFTAAGREEGRDPYLRHLYRAALDGSRIELLTPEDADHEITVSPDGRYVVDTYSRYDLPPTSVVRDPSGRVTQTLEEADIDALLEAGWRFPEPFRAKARDGVTDVYGLLYLPSHFDPEGTYPVVDYVYPGPQTGPIGLRRFNANPRGNAQALAELGFIVFLVDALGTPGRSKAFHDSYYGNMGDNGIPDHISVLQQLALRYPQMDLDRVGIFGHSGGGFASTDAILRYPEFFDVAVSSAGNHDNRSYDYTWGEKYQGLVEESETGGDSFDSQANHLMADKLEGKLLLMYGTLDDNVHPNATLLLIDELIEHNKDFDLIVLPNRNHGYANEPYVVRRTWDYFVRHLLGQEPPRGVRLSAAEPRD